MGRRVVEGGQNAAGRQRSRRRLPAHGAQVGATLPRRRPRRLNDRSSRPHRLRCPTPPEVIERIEALRRQRFTGQQIA